MVCDDRLGNGGPDSVNLGRDTTPLDPDADIQVGELVLAKDEDRLEDLQTHDLRLDVLNGLPIDLDKTPPLLGKGNSRGCLFPVVVVCFSRVAVEGTHEIMLAPSWSTTETRVERMKLPHFNKPWARTPAGVIPLSDRFRHPMLSRLGFALSLLRCRPSVTTSCDACC
jgi:hypothetical protein